MGAFGAGAFGNVLAVFVVVRREGA